MLPKKNRLTTNQFDRSFRKSKKIHTELARFLISNGRENTKCAVVVSKKIAKSAVKRNRIRRQIYALMDQIIPKKLAKNIICLYKGPVVFDSPGDFRASCENMLKKIT